MDIIMHSVYLLCWGRREEHLLIPITNLHYNVILTSPRSLNLWTGGCEFHNFWRQLHDHHNHAFTKNIFLNRGKIKNISTILQYWPALGSEPLTKRALNFTVLVDGFIDIIILHVVFSNLYVIREKAYIFTILAPPLVLTQGAWISQFGVEAPLLFYWMSSSR